MSPSRRHFNRKILPHPIKKELKAPLLDYLNPRLVEAASNKEGIERLEEVLPYAYDLATSNKEGIERLTWLANERAAKMGGHPIKKDIESSPTYTPSTTSK
ncbi:hypothetical protein B6U99_04845 [Candidatus Geothermarchaeota archaeon ex4572_27]|nr:MAG: hypothetical protein B6U99_04845 [Candidatus Geothermarchaeota archaeon ex4572_27]